MSKLGRTCTQCQGRTWEPTSDSDPTPVPCVACESTGYEKIGEVDNSDLESAIATLQTKVDSYEDKINDTFDLCTDLAEALIE